MKLLLSAYACEPNKGSEPGVGWNWAIEIVRLGHDVWVLTRTNNEKSITAYFSQHSQPKNLHFLYYDLPNWGKWWKKGGYFIHLYYVFWQWGAYCFAKKEHQKKSFDKVHHITFVSVRQPSFMGGLGIPFIFGPVGGGERAPIPLRWSYDLHGIILDFIRDMVNFIIRFDPLMHLTFNQAEKIYATSEQTRSLIPKKFHDKTHIQLAIGVSKLNYNKILIKSHRESQLKILYIGKFIYWKGMIIGLHAFAQAVQIIPTLKLTIIGEGPDEKQWKLLVKKLNIEENIEWLPWVSQNNLNEIYCNHDILLFPSLHDSGGMVVLEAMNYGMPVICFDLGGPNYIVNDTCGVKVKTDNLNNKEAIKIIKLSILDICTSNTKITLLSKGAIRKAKQYFWGNVIKNIYNNEH